MKKKWGIMVVVVISLLSLSVVTPVSAANLLHVDDDGLQWPGAYSTINEAIGAADDGDTIIVHEGTYAAFELRLRNNISITGVGDPVVNVSMNTSADDWGMAYVDESTNINIEGINFDGAGVIGHAGNGAIGYANSTGAISDVSIENFIGTVIGNGILVISNEGTHSVQISDVTVENTQWGIWVVNAQASIYDCQIDGNGLGESIGIYLWYNAIAEVVGNTINNSNDGIRIDGSSNNIINENEISASGEHGISIINNSDENQIIENVIKKSSGDGIFLENSNKNTIAGNEISDTSSFNGIVLFGGDDNIINENEIKNSGACGISINGSDNNIVSGNKISGSGKHGIHIKNSSNNNTIEENVIKKSDRVGIRVAETSNNNTIKENIVKKSGVYDLFQDLSSSNIWEDNKYKTSEGI